MYIYYYIILDQYLFSSLIDEDLTPYGPPPNTILNVNILIPFSLTSPQRNNITYIKPLIQTYGNNILKNILDSLSPGEDITILYSKYISVTLYSRTRKILRDIVIPQIITPEIYTTIKAHYFSIVSVNDDFWSNTILQSLIKLSCDLLKSSAIV